MERQLIDEDGYTISWVIGSMQKSTTFSIFYSRWTDLAFRLDTEDTVKSRIQHFQTHGEISLTEIIRQLLVDWKSGSENDATVGNLHLALNNMKMNDVAEKLKQAFNEKVEDQANTDLVDTSLNNSHNAGNEPAAQPQVELTEPPRNPTDATPGSQPNIKFNLYGIEVNGLDIPVSWLIPVTVAIMAMVLFSCYKNLFY